MRRSCPCGHDRSRRRIDAVTDGAHRVVIVGYDRAQSLDICGPAEVFAAAGPERYRVEVVAPGGQTIRCTSGITLAPDGALETAAGDVGTLIVARRGGRREAAPHPPVIPAGP